jgi:hypothetical protein
MKEGLKIKIQKSFIARNVVDDPVQRELGDASIVDLVDPEAFLAESMETDVNGARQDQKEENSMDALG